MIYYKRIFLSVFLISTLFFSACTLNQMTQLAGEQELTVSPSPLELHGDSVGFIMSAKLPANMLKPGTIYEVETSYKPDNGSEISLGKVAFDAGQFTGSEQPQMQQYFSFLYDESLNPGQVYIKGIARKDDKIKETAKIPVPNGGRGIITTSQLLQPTYYVNYVDHGYDGSEEYEPQYVDFFFLKGRSNLRYSEKRSDRGGQLDEYIAAKNPTRSVNLTGMHSPEGSTDINNRLANERPKTVEEYYKSLAEKYDYTDEAGNINFVVKPVVEDWTEFKKLLGENTRLTEAQKNEVLAVVNGPGNFVSKELKLQTLPSYRILLRDIYPPLRTAKAEILKIKKKLTEPEIMVLAQKISKEEEEATALSDAQLAYAAYKTPSMEEKEAMYKAWIKKSDSYAAYNNLGAVYLEMASKESDPSKEMELMDKALEQFEKSLEKQESAEVMANMAGIYLKKGDEEKANEMLDKVSSSSASAVGTSVNALKGYMAIKDGTYREAIQNLSSAGNNAMVLYNRALAYLLQASFTMNEEGYTRAMSQFEEAISADQNNAYAYYGAAITAARLQDVDKLVENLKKAVSLNSDLKTRAVKDLEFVNYFDNASFRSAL